MALLISRSRRPQFKLRPQQFNQGNSRTLPAPYGGLNLRDDITAMQPNEARVLDNWLTKAGTLSLRDGYEQHATGVGSGQVETLASFIGLTSSKLIACAGGKIYDATSSGAATELDDGFSVNRWQTALYNNRLIMVNGTDAPQDFNGTAIGATAWTGSGLTITNLVNVGAVFSRLWFCENAKADVWYGPIGGVTGALTKFELSQIATGGTCTAVGSWSRDDGAGSDDATVFVMSTGEIIVYQGDPGSTFSLVGKYWTGAPPIGRRCLVKVGGELLIITRLGFLPVSAAIGGVALDLSRIDPWGKIAPGVVSDVGFYGGIDGWQAVLHAGIVYLQVPTVSGVVAKQRVLNTRTGTWSTFTGWPAQTICSFGNDLYLGGFNGTIWKVGAKTDNGSAIVARSAGAFLFPGKSQINNMFTAIRPKVEASTGVVGQIGVDTDFFIEPTVGEFVQIATSGGLTPWGSPWGSPWGASSSADPTWFSITGEGRSVSVRFAVEAATNAVQWFATDLAFKPGGIR